MQRGGVCCYRQFRVCHTVLITAHWAVVLRRFLLRQHGAYALPTKYNDQYCNINIITITYSLRKFYIMFNCVDKAFYFKSIQPRAYVVFAFADRNLT